MTISRDRHVGRHVALEPLNEEHRNGLRAAADHDLWTWFPFNAQRDFDGSFFDPSLKAQESGRMIVFAVRRLSDGELVGSTRWLNIALEHRRAEIGSTWYRPDVQGTAVNPECKYLLMCEGFEKADLVRVELKTDARNARSRAAIRKLGAREEGTLRRHLINWDGFIRDTVYYSILADEWPGVKAGLEARRAAAPN